MSLYTVKEGVTLQTKDGYKGPGSTVELDAKAARKLREHIQPAAAAAPPKDDGKKDGGKSDNKPAAPPAGKKPT